MQNGTNLKQFKSIKCMDFSGSRDDIKSVHSINSYITFKGAMCYYITMDIYNGYIYNGYHITMDIYNRYFTMVN